MSNNQEHTNTDNMENQTQQALEKDSAQYANEVTGAENAAEKDSAGKKRAARCLEEMKNESVNWRRVLRSGCGGLCTVRFFSGTCFQS